MKNTLETLNEQVNNKNRRAKELDKSHTFRGLEAHSFLNQADLTI